MDLTTIHQNPILDSPLKVIEEEKKGEDRSS